MGAKSSLDVSLLSPKKATSTL